MQDFLKNLIKDIAVDLHDEFDRNFERKSFFGKTWEQSSIPNKRGSLLARTGKLRKSLKARVSGNQISFSSSLAYANLQNEGGTVVVTQKMKSFFWAMYYQASNALVFSVKTKAAAKTKKNVRLSAEAQVWKALALQKVGATMKIKQRQFIGDHPQVRQRIETAVNSNMKELEKQLFDQLKKHSR